jgi:hypothetical protein
VSVVRVVARRALPFGNIHDTGDAKRQQPGAAADLIHRHAKLSDLGFFGPPANSPHD